MNSIHPCWKASTAPYPELLSCLCLQVIVQPAPRSQFTEKADLQLLVPEELSFAKFFFKIRERLELGPEQALFFTIANTIPSLSATIASVYEVSSITCDDYTPKVQFHLNWSFYSTQNTVFAVLRFHELFSNELTGQTNLSERFGLYNKVHTLNSYNKGAGFLGF